MGHLSETSSLKSSSSTAGQATLWQALVTERKSGSWSCRELLRRAVTSEAWAIIIFVAVATDLLLCAAIGTKSCRDAACRDLLHLDFKISVGVVAIYTADVGLKMYLFKPMIYLRKCGNIVDFAVTLASLAFMFVQRLGLEAGTAALRAPRVLSTLSWAVSFGHCGRSFSRLQMMASHCFMGARHIVGQNRRRYIDMEHDFDLDLAYVEGSLVAMSVPAVGLRALYRNPLEEVVRFFELFHPEQYMIVNCCPEIDYPHSAFTTGRVEVFDIQDHTPPKLSQFVRFLNIVLNWMVNEKRIVAVHCRGGKGRTGSLCCGSMLYRQTAQDAKAACDLFAAARTDWFFEECGLMRVTPQTVDTPSQVRYLRHLEAMLAEQKAYWPSRVVEPPVKPLQPLALTIRRFFTRPPKKPLIIALHEAASEDGEHRVALWSSEFVVDDTGSAHVTLDAPLVRGDARVSIFTADRIKKARAADSRGLAFPGDMHPTLDWQRLADHDLTTRRQRRVRAGKEPGCLFYFLFHTTYVGLESRPAPGGGDALNLDVPRSDMDRASKGKRRRLYREDGVVTLTFRLPSASSDSS